MQNRLLHIVKKEFIQLARDPRMLFIAMVTPVIQLMLFGYIATTDIKNIETVVYNRDNTYISREYIETYKNTGYFKLAYFTDSLKEVNNYLDSGLAKVAIKIPQDFSVGLLSSKGTSVQANVDGTDSTMASIVLGYIGQINQEYNYKKLKDKLKRTSISMDMFEPIDLRLRVWYNPDLKSVNYMVPAIIAVLLMIQSMVLTSFAIVKEKVRGTLEQLIVSPIKPYEIILGKMIPSICIALFVVVMVALVGTLWFGVPLRGNFLLLIALSLVYLLTAIGLGAFVSTVSETERQAIFTSIFILIPSIILSGFVFPIDNMPKIIQFLTYFISARYFIPIIRGIFLKGIGINYLWKEAFPLIIIGSVIFILSFRRFRKKIN